MAQGRLVAAILIGLAVAALVVASALSFIWNTGRTVSGVADLGGLSAHPDRAMDTATLIFRHSRGELGGIAIAPLRDALAMAPLEEEPFVYAAASLANAGRVVEASRLLRIAEERNPRSREARAMLLQHAVADADAREAVTQIEVLHRLEPELRPALSETLIYLASVPTTQQATLAAIREDRHKRDVLQGLARWGASPSMLLSAIGELGEFDLGPDRRGYVRSLVNPLLATEDWRGARRVWSVYYPGAFDGDMPLVDPAFSGEYGPPFGWATQDGRDGWARTGDEGLRGRYTGLGQAELARQLVLAEPGRYRLNIQSVDPGSGLWIEVACGSSPAFAQQQLAEEMQTVEFTAGSDCPALNLTIAARPTASQSAQDFRIIGIEMERIAP